MDPVGTAITCHLECSGPQAPEIVSITLTQSCRSCARCATLALSWCKWHRRMSVKALHRKSQYPEDWQGCSCKKRAGEWLHQRLPTQQDGIAVRQAGSVHESCLAVTAASPKTLALSRREYRSCSPDMLPGMNFGQHWKHTAGAWLGDQKVTKNRSITCHLGLGEA